MNKLKIFCGILFLSICTITLLSWKSKTENTKNIAAAKRPNIIVIMADDMGFSDAGCYGGEINTPNIDFLAQNGIRYRQFYNTSRCCPTRASLLTGLYNQQAGIGKMTEAENAPGYQGHLTENAVTIAEILKSAGYHTAMSGKWHVSNTFSQKNPQDQLNWLNHQKDFGPFSPLEQYPTAKGFEKFFGTIWGVIDFFDPFSLVNGTEPVKSVPKDYYHTDAINDTTVSYIKEYAKSDKPFFIYVAQNAPHWPLMAKPKDIAKYKETYKAGWDVIRQQRYQKMIRLGLIDAATTKLPQDPADELKWENNPDKEWDATAMAVHAAMIDNMDQGIGRIISALKQTAQLDNTLILFLSDNGASAENCANYGPGFDRPSQTRDGKTIVYATKKQAIPGPQTTYSSIGPRWAHVANTPYRYWKEQSFDGGIHTPMIAFWPKGITVKKGGFNDFTGHVMDFMLTFCDLAGVKYPAQFNGKKITPSSGKSLAASFQNKNEKGHAQLFNEHFGARYVRNENWKLVALPRDSSWHLYDMTTDKAETTDLATKYPSKVHQLDSLWNNWANNHQVFPKPGVAKGK